MSSPASIQSPINWDKLPQENPERWYQSNTVRKVACIAFTCLAVLAALAAVAAALCFAASMAGFIGAGATWLALATPMTYRSLFYISACVAGISTLTAIFLGCLKPHPNSLEERMKARQELKVAWTQSQNILEPIDKLLERKIVTPEEFRTLFHPKIEENFQKELAAIQ